MLLSGIVARVFWFLEGVARNPEGSGGGNGNNPSLVFLTAVEFAEMVRLSPRTVEKLRLEGRGPKYFRLGEGGRSKVVYRLADVLAWLEKHQKG